MGDLAVAHPEAAGAARIVAGHVVDALADQLRHQQPGAEPAQHRLEVVLRPGQLRAQLQVVGAAGVAGALHAQLARRVGRQEVAAQHAVGDHVARGCAHTLLVEGARADAARHVRVLADRHVRREQRPVQRVDEERGLAVKRAAAGRLHEAAEQPAGQRRLEQHRHLASPQAPRRQARQRATRRILAERPRRGERRRHPRGAVPVVALHAVPVLRDRGDRQRVARVREAGAEAARVGQHEVPRGGVDVGTLGVDDLRADGEGRAFGFLRDLDRLLDLQVPRMEQVQVARRPLERVLVRQAGGGVLGGEAGDVVGSLDRLADRRRGKVRRRCVAAPGADIDGDAEALVARVLDGLHLRPPRADGQPDRLADVGHGVAGAELTRQVERLLRNGGELVVGQGKQGAHRGIRRWRSRGGRTAGYDSQRWFTKPPPVHRLPLKPRPSGRASRSASAT